MDLNKINKASFGGLLPTWKIVDLVENRVYPVTCTKRFETRFGVKTTIELNHEANVFLNNATCDIMLDDPTFDQFRQRISAGSLYVFRPRATTALQFIDSPTIQNVREEEETNGVNVDATSDQ